MGATSTTESERGARHPPPGWTTSIPAAPVLSPEVSERIDKMQRDRQRSSSTIQFRAVPVSRTARAAGFSSLFAQIAYDKLFSKSTDGGLLSLHSHQRVVDTLCRMRGSVLKLGQMLSIQDASTVPPHITALFQKVRDQAFAMPDVQLRRTLMEEFKHLERPPEHATGEAAASFSPGFNWRKDLFVDFEEVPIAAASIGQVHHAILRGKYNTAERMRSEGSSDAILASSASVPFGEDIEVAVKVQYPGVAASINSDVANLKMLMSMNILPPGMFVDRILSELQAELSVECQYQLEARKQNTYGALVAADPLLADLFHVPVAYEQLGTDRVLVAEYVSGIPIDKIADACPQEVATAVDAAQDYKNYIAEKMMRLTLTELFQWRLMQTDPNYANFLFDAKRQRVNLLDFGAAREYPAEFVNTYLDVVAAAALGDRQTIIDKSITLGFLTGREVSEMIDAHVASVMTLGKPFRPLPTVAGAPPPPGSRPPYAAFDFHAENLPSQISAHVPTMVKLRLVPPPTPVYSLHRRLSGTILLLTRLQATVPCATIFWATYDRVKEAEAKHAA